MMTSNPDQPSFKILICLIRIWDADVNDLMTIPNEVDTITEVKSIEISESFENIVDTAKVKFPKGTVLRKTLDEINAKEDVKKVDVSMSDTGVVHVIKSQAKIAEVADFSVGRRIQIKLGYTEDPAIASLTKSRDGRKTIYNSTEARNKYEEAMNYVFEGYITQCGLEEPIEIKCEDLGHMTKKVMCPYIGSVSKSTVNDFLSSDGRYKLLEDTGLALYSKTKNANVNVGKFSSDKNMTVYELLSSWAKNKLYSFTVIDDSNKPCVACAKSYLTNAGEDSVINVMNKDGDIPEIDFGYHVANNGLALSRIDPLFLAVRATGTDSNGKQLHMVVMLNPENTNEYRVINESGLSKKEKKAGKINTKVDLKQYTVVQFHSDTDKVTRDQLKKEAIEYFESYNKNGLEGSLTLFGDFGNISAKLNEPYLNTYGKGFLYTGGKVRLNDQRQPAKNGVYLVGEVITRFGTEGYRKIIKLPYCLSLDSENNG